MSIKQGSLRYTPSGRKRRPTYKTHRSKNIELLPEAEPKVAPFRRQTREVKSLDISKVPTHKPQPKENFREEVSKKYTLAPAYNKGAYQVIPRDCVKDIGK